MKMNVKGLVFVGFAAAVFAGAANAADKIVTSKSYVDAKVVNSMAGSQTDAAPSVAAVKGSLENYATTGSLGTAAAANVATGNTPIAEDGTGLVTSGQVYDYVAEQLTSNGGTVNDNTITVQLNGSTVDSFKTNNAADKTINISGVQTTANISNAVGDDASSTTKYPSVKAMKDYVDGYAAAGAEVNTIEAVQVNGTDLTPDANDKVNITVTTGDSTTGVGSIKVNGTGVTVYGLGTAAAANTTAFDAAGTAAGLVGDLPQGYNDVVSYVGAVAGTANTAVQSVTTGATAGTIAVDGTDVSVYGLGTAAYEAKSTNGVTNGDTGLVTGGQVYTAIDNAVKISVPAPATGKCGAGAPCALVLENGTATWETIQQVQAGE